jgi:hypothetical protein
VAASRQPFCASGQATGDEMRKKLFAAYVGGMFVDMVEATSLREAKRLFKYLEIRYDLVEAV